MSMIGLVLATLFSLADQDTISVISEREIRPLYNQTEYESACGSTAFRVRFRNGPKESGRVDYVLVGGRPERDIAATLDLRAARRTISSFEIMDCGMDPLQPVFRGAMVLSEAESHAAGMRHLLFFRLTRHGKGWQIAID